MQEKKVVELSGMTMFNLKKGRHIPDTIQFKIVDLKQHMVFMILTTLLFQVVILMKTVLQMKALPVILVLELKDQRSLIRIVTFPNM